MSKNWNNPNTVGAVYKCLSTTEDFVVGVFYLCAKHTGDCHYTWVAMRETPGNDKHRYFTGTKTFSAYSAPQDWLASGTEVQTIEDLASFFLGMVSGNGSLQLTRPESRSVYEEISEELRDMLQTVVPPKVLELCMTKAGVTVE